MESRLKKIFSLIFLLSFLTFFHLAKAITIPNPLEETTIVGLIDSLTTMIFWIVIIIIPLMIIIGALYYLSSGGNPEKIRTARNILLYTLIGFFIVLLAKGLISVIKSIIGE